MCTRQDCQQYVGRMVQFRTQWGNHVGVIERVTDDTAVVLSPRQQIPTNLASAEVSEDEAQRLDLALARWGGMGAGYAGAPGYGGGPGYGGAPGYGAGPGYGYPAYGWGFGWARWAVAFLWIFALWGLFLW
ncbi:hypothetical protein JC200_08250 [Alicyclobacillus sp. ALC3]|nr:hypothetical protein JC200_08250 [Alicyclobacillus sp. ALC3]